LTNADLEKIVDTSDEWITTRTGIKERRILDEGLGTSYMATRAVQQLLKQTSTEPDEVDLIDYTDRSTCVLFGDGAGAVMLEPTEDEMGMQDFVLHVDGAGGPHLCQPGGGSLHPASHETVDKRMHFIRQDGREVFKFASKAMADSAAEVLERNGLTGEDVALLVPHQANKRIIDACAKRMKLPSDRVVINIEKYGNTTAGTIPIALSEAVEQGRVRRGDRLVFASAGGGYVWGSALLRWAY